MLRPLFKYYLLLHITISLCSFQSIDEKNLIYSGITSENGLDSDESNFVYQDNDGFLWIGTNGGLFRYDGYEILNFETLVPNSKEIIGKARYFGLVQDKNDHLWISCSAGIFSYDKLSTSVELIKKGSEIFDDTYSGSSIAIEYDPSGKIWFGGNKGIFIYNIESGISLHHNSIIKEENTRGLRDIMISSSGDVWLATWGKGLGRYIPDNNTFEVFNDFDRGPLTDKHNVLNSLFEDENGLLWVGTWDEGLYVLDISNPKVPQIIKWFGQGDDKSTCLPSNIIYDLNSDINGDIWIGTPFGLSIIRHKDNKAFEFVNYDCKKRNDQLVSNEIRGIIRDRSGLMWLAIFGGGVNKFDLRRNNFPLYNITAQDPRKSQSIHSFTKDPMGRLLMGVQSMGFGIYDLNKRTFMPYEKVEDYESLFDLGLNTIKNFTWDKNGNLWIGGRFKGLIKYDVKRKKFVSVSGRIKKNQVFKEVFKVQVDLDNNVWAMSNKGLFRVEQGEKFDDNRLRNINPLNKKDGTKTSYSDFTISKSGYLYLSTNKGDIFKSSASVYSIPLEEQSFKRIDRPVEGNVSVNTLFVDSRDRLWVGTNTGLENYGEDSILVNPDLLPGIKNLSVHSFEEDEKGNMIATSNKGLIYIDNLSGKPVPNFYTTRNGLQANYFIKGSLFKDNTGKVYAGGHHGFNIIDPIKIKDDYVKPSLTFTNLHTNKKNLFGYKGYSKNNPLVINYDDNIITLSFASMDFRDADNLNYAFKLEGLDEDWKFVSANNRTATYVNLRPGEYDFQVKATNANGQWSKDGLTLPIFVETAPYFTWWAFTIYVLIILGIISSIFILYRRKIIIKQALNIENIERLKSEKLNQFKLQFFTNLSHELLTPLSVLAILSDKKINNNNDDGFEEQKILRRNIKVLNDRIKQMLNFRKAESGNMDYAPSWKNISEIIQEISKDYSILAQEKDIDFRVVMAENLKGYVDVEKLEICINNILSNAFKYTPREGIVNLIANIIGHNGGKRLIIKVNDTGKGISDHDLQRIFNRYYRPKSVKGYADGLGIGLALTKHLVEIQQGIIRVESEEGVGTQFELELPVGRYVLNLEGVQNNSGLINAENISALEKEDEINVLDDVEYSGKAVLIVEDNEDYLNLVKEYLQDYYKVFASLDAENALKLANSEDIDLIVSDLQLPGMNGHKLCESIKNNVSTSHIPVVIVTAHDDDDERKKGYEIGVDTYFTKPISLDVLVYRIESLLKKRESIHRKFNKGDFLEPEKIVSTNIDEEFLSKAKECVENHISEPDFSVKILCSDMGMSNSMFYRKIKGILDLTPNEFIKNIRLRRAAQLLEDKSIHISEVAYMVGFNDLSYFGVCFKKQYGFSPSTFQKNLFENEKDSISS
ncbi:MAG: hypothetical protein CL868_14305 [Cytophagaceae bacterium]|nr:hypothetical protein [Cytophagaceae bacterium]|tara:strand:- start:4052 stop:8191 length:4140 start_codon:yes stop_codon:yes gene_type:complete